MHTQYIHTYAPTTKEKENKNPTPHWLLFPTYTNTPRKKYYIHPSHTFWDKQLKTNLHKKDLSKNTVRQKQKLNLRIAFVILSS